MCREHGLAVSAGSGLEPVTCRNRQTNGAERKKYMSKTVAIVLTRLYTRSSSKTEAPKSKIVAFKNRGLRNCDFFTLASLSKPMPLKR